MTSAEITLYVYVVALLGMRRGETRIEAGKGYWRVVQGFGISRTRRKDQPKSTTRFMGDVHEPFDLLLSPLPIAIKKITRWSPSAFSSCGSPS